MPLESSRYIEIINASVPDGTPRISDLSQDPLASVRKNVIDKIFSKARINTPIDYEYEAGIGGFDPIALRSYFTSNTSRSYDRSSPATERANKSRENDIRGGAAVNSGISSSPRRR